MTVDHDVIVPGGGAPGGIPVPLDVLVDVVQPFPTSSEVHQAALNTLVRVIAEDARPLAVTSS
jgi:hypothetical protein